MSAKLVPFLMPHRRAGRNFDWDAGLGAPNVGVGGGPPEKGKENEIFQGIVIVGALGRCCDLFIGIKWSMSANSKASRQIVFDSI
jgi:hypothetical protein